MDIIGQIAEEVVRLYFEGCSVKQAIKKAKEMYGYINCDKFLSRINRLSQAIQEQGCEEISKSIDCEYEL